MPEADQPEVDTQAPTAIMKWAPAPSGFTIFGGESWIRYLSRSGTDLAAAGACSDESLMRRWQAGDPAAFRALYSRFADRLFRFVAQFSASRAEAEEICQETWLAVVDGRARYRSDARFPTYLFSIARRRAIDRLRRAGRHREDWHEPEALASVAEEDARQPERLVHGDQSAQALLAAIAELPILQREAFLMHAEGDMSLDEIAVATDSAREAVKSRLRYAMRRLRAALAGLE